MRLKGRERRHKRIRKRILGTEARPRLCVFRSLKHIYGMLIDDLNNRTILTVSSLNQKIRKGKKKKKKVEVAREVGKLLAKMALERNIVSVVFDRAGYKYHGRVKALAEGAREGGLKF
ncbi:50S ribosomal protein L18 [candidate division WOR-3 bacterium]|uniref:Large ribosomal subunit protein uL18 n=1 Tax=candidate division WOR-3 bacterium TaxID=2052148 RepID=A0A660SD73_UNCW3|nr:MAG: 50S ribosomal protein L18 [candidate division WOR-3 bacterium]